MDYQYLGDKMATEKVHKLGGMGVGCICNDPNCKKWKDAFPKPGTEKRCKNCWTLLSKRENEDGTTVDWCINCAQAELSF